MANQVNDVFATMLNIMTGSKVYQKKEDMVYCPYCGSTDFITEREIPVVVSYSINNSVKIDGVMRPVERECSFFCSCCKKDF